MEINVFIGDVSDMVGVVPHIDLIAGAAEPLTKAACGAGHGVMRVVDSCVSSTAACSGELARRRSRTPAAIAMRSSAFTR